MNGFWMLYQSPNDATFADITRIDESLADNILTKARDQPDSDSENSIFTRFSRVHARIVGSDSVKFNRETGMLLEKNSNRPATEGAFLYNKEMFSQLSRSQQATIRTLMKSGQTIPESWDSSNLTLDDVEEAWGANCPEVKETPEEIFGGGAPLPPYPRIDDDDPDDTWGPNSATTIPIQSSLTEA